MKATLLTLFAFIASINATAQTRHYELTVGEFHELEVIDGINVDYNFDPYRAGKVEFEATSDVASAIMFHPEEGKLKIQLASRDTIYSSLPTVNIYSTFLSKVTNEGDSTLRVLTINPGPSLEACLIGNGRLVVRDARTNKADISILTGKGTLVIYGTADNASFSVTGAGQIEADDFKVKDAKCTLTGTGSIFCYPTHELSVKGIGSIKVFYRGNPKIKKNWLSNAKIISLDQEN